MPKMLFINSAAQTVVPVECDTLESMQLMLNGYIEAAMPFGIRDTLYINEDRRTVAHSNMFRMGAGPIMWGNGLICGPSDTDGYDTDATMTLEQATKAVTFYARDQDTRASIDRPFVAPDNEEGESS